MYQFERHHMSVRSPRQVKDVSDQLLNLPLYYFFVTGVYEIITENRGDRGVPTV